MGTQPLPVNQAATQAAALTKQLEDILVPIAENAIIAACPTLGLPVVKQITQAIEVAIADKITALIETGVVIPLVIDTQIGIEKINMAADQKALVAALKSGDQNAINTALANFQKSHGALVNSDGTATPQ